MQLEWLNQTFQRQVEVKGPINYTKDFHSDWQFTDMLWSRDSILSVKLVMCKVSCTYVDWRIIKRYQWSWKFEIRRTILYIWLVD